MISLEKQQILTSLQKLSNNVGNLGKLIVAKGFKKLPKVQKISQSGHTVNNLFYAFTIYYPLMQGAAGIGDPFESLCQQHYNNIAKYT